MDFSVFDDSVSYTMNVFLVIGNIINTFLFLICNVVSVGASFFISYYKIIDLYKEYRYKHYFIIENELEQVCSSNSNINCHENLYIEYNI